MLQGMGFVQNKAEAKMSKGNRVYKYMAVYVDDLLLITAGNPKDIVDTLQETNGFN